MSDQHQAPRNGPKRALTWLSAAVAVAVVALVVVLWNSNPDDEGLTFADTTPVLNDPGVEVEEDELVEEDFDAASADAVVDDGEVAEPIREAGEEVIHGPNNPVDNADTADENAVANEAAIENEIISDRAAQDDQENSPVTEAQRIADEIEVEATDEEIQ